MSPPEIDEAPPVAAGEPQANAEFGPHIDNLTPAQVQDCLEAAEAYEIALARRQYELRQFILNCKVYLDHLAELGDAFQESKAA